MKRGSACRDSGCYLHPSRYSNTRHRVSTNSLVSKVSWSVAGGIGPFLKDSWHLNLKQPSTKQCSAGVGHLSRCRHPQKRGVVLMIPDSVEVNGVPLVVYDSIPN